MSFDKIVLHSSLFTLLHVDEYHENLYELHLQVTFRNSLGIFPHLLAIS